MAHSSFVPFSPKAKAAFVLSVLSPTAFSGPPLVSGSSSCTSTHPQSLRIPVAPHPTPRGVQPLVSGSDSPCSLQPRWEKVGGVAQRSECSTQGSQPPASESVMNLCSKPGPSPYLLSAASLLIAYLP